MKYLIFHPIVAATYPILTLLAFNIDETPLSSASRAIIVSIIFMCAIWLLLFCILRNPARAALITSLVIVFIYSYGHTHTLETSMRIFGLDILSHRYLIPIYLSIVAGAIWGIVFKLKNVADITYGLNFVGLVLIVFPLYQLMSFHISISQAEQSYESSNNPNSAESLTFEARPDIYLLILDMYPRGDYLLDEMNFDNSNFLNSLEERGFFVADCALSNYSFTRFSLTSLLNMNYIDVLLPNVGIADTERSLVDPLIKSSLVRDRFEELGYSIVAFQTDFPATSLDDADVYYDFDSELSTITIDQLAPKPGTLEGIEISLSDNSIGSALVNLNLTKFEWLLIQTSALRIIPDLFLKTNTTVRPDDDYLERLRQYHLNNKVLDALQSVPVEIKSPKFVFFHLISPHPPIVFDQNGSFTAPYTGKTTEDWERAFTAQLSYVNKRILEIVEGVQSGSSDQPIIIIQGDHGPPIVSEPGFQNSEVLAAYYTPYQELELPSNLSSVNVFRQIFNSYFGANYEYLEDKAYTSQWNVTPYEFIPVEEKRPDCISK